jgi:hypothetical protein
LCFTVSFEEKAEELANMTLNARSDAIHQKPSFNNSIEAWVDPLNGYRFSEPNNETLLH